MAENKKIPWDRRKIEALEKKCDDLASTIKLIRLTLIDYGCESVDLMLGTIDYRVSELQDRAAKNLTDATSQAKRYKEGRIKAAEDQADLLREKILKKKPPR